MKKATLISLIVLVLGAIGVIWLLLKPSTSEVSVSVDFNRDTSLSAIQKTQKQFRVATEDKLHLDCNEQLHTVVTPSSTAGVPMVGCNGTYTPDNFLQLFRYQENLFKIAEADSLNFTSIIEGGSFIERWLD